MQQSRRTLLITAAMLAASAPLRALAACAAGSLTAGEVVERIRRGVGIPWQAETVDRIVAGAPATRVTGIATTMMATQKVLQRAASSGLNMVVTHEPTFYSHFDTVQELADDATYRHKRDFIAANDMVVFRFHDHWHAMSPDGVAVGMARALGWEKHADPSRPGEFVLPRQPLEHIADVLARRLGARSIRVMGNPTLQVSRVAAAWGYAAFPDRRVLAARPDIDLLIVGEAREWELVPYVADQIAAGANKALIVLGHVASEQEGMRYCAQWLQTLIDTAPIEFIATEEPFGTQRETAK